jgi:glycosidase
VYNLFPRVTTAFNHSGNGHLLIGPNGDGWRETGTLLKCIAILPYIQMMGFNTVHLLPITSIGQDGKKGNLGSPYAIRNPYLIDENLTEPALDLTADQLFAGFVDAAHLLGMRVVMEFVLRTASKDSDWIREHPDWFYWIRADVPDRTTRMGRTGMLNSFGQPFFAQDTLNQIHAKISGGDFNELPPPPAHYMAFYTPTPRPDQIYGAEGRYLGGLDDGTQVRIPGAFADWPPNDSQPPWSDVTYLRLYHHPDYNYMAYNTLRMYDNRLATPANRNLPLWDAICGVIPHYQRNFGIDGVLIDMGHALPMPLKQRMIITAREINPDFAFWDENFSISQHSSDEGYDAVVGYWMLCVHEGQSVRNMLNQMAHHPFPLPFFAAPENHNTPRAFARYGGVAYAHYALALSITIPAIPFILSGFELGETQPINTGLGFNYEQLTQYNADRLPLFSAWEFNWTRPDNYIKSVKVALSIRKKYAALLTDNSPETFLMGYSDNPHFIVYSRRKGDQCISVIGNSDLTHEHHGRVVVNAYSMRVPGLWGTSEAGMDMHREVMANVTLSPGYVLILDGAKTQC